MKDKIFGVLQRVGRSFMLPIAILPVAGLLLGLGSSFTNATTIATYGLQGILGEQSRKCNFRQPSAYLCRWCSHRYGKEGERSCSVICTDRILCYAHFY